MPANNMPSTHVAIHEGLLAASSLLRAGQAEAAGQRFAQSILVDPANPEWHSLFLECLRPSSPASTNGPLSRTASEIVRQKFANDWAQTLSIERTRASLADTAENHVAEDWVKALEVGILHLTLDPDHVPALMGMAEATLALGSLSSSLCYLKRSAETSPTDVTVLQKLAIGYSRAGWRAESLHVWKQVDSLIPGDADVAKAISQQAIESSRQKNGWGVLPCVSRPLSVEASLTTRSHDEPSATRAPLHSNSTLARSDDARLTPIQRLEASLRDFPNRIEIYLELADLYLRSGRDFDAERLLATGLTATGDALPIRELWETISLRRWDKKCEFSEEHARLENTTEAQEALAGNRLARERFELEVFSARCERHPLDSALRFQFGLRLKRAGKSRDAGRQFELAMRNANVAGPAAFEWAECNEAAGDLPRAMALYRRASNLAGEVDDGELKRRALQKLANLAQRLQLNQLHWRYLKEWQRYEPQNQEAAAALRMAEQATGSAEWVRPGT